MISLSGYSNITSLYNSDRSKIFTAIRDKDKKKVVLKTSAKELPLAVEVSRLKKEFNNLKTLNINGVPKVYDFIYKNSTYIIVREYFDKKPLSTYINKNILTQQDILKIAIGITKILKEVHENGYIYQDLNPNNILISQDFDNITLIDFDSAIHMPRHKNSGVEYQNIETTLAYMSPEQTGRMNRHFDYRTDFYSFGITLYELISGKNPFYDKDLNKLIHNHIASNPKPVHKIDKNISKNFSNIIKKLISKDANERYQSAYGLYCDLQELYKDSNLDSELSLGENDLKDRFIIPEKLYGREKEAQELVDIFEKVNHGSSELVLITGESGIGKTSFVKELSKNVSLKNGYMVSGKYEQYNRNIPYSGIITAITALLKQILFEPKENIKNWKNKILQTLDSQAQYIIDIIPELELIIGKQPAITKTEQLEAKVVFNRLFQNFISVFGSPKHPLVLFLDDLQWIDDSSLKLLETIALAPNLKSVMIIGAYRNNEVNETHPLNLHIKELSKQDAKISEIFLSYLDVETITLMLKDIFHTDKKSLNKLVKLLHKNTHGNPLFVKAILQNLYQNEYVYYDYKNKTWKWDISLIQKIPYSDNVIDIMQKNISNFPKETLEIFALASCMGNTFTFDILHKLSNTTKASLAKDLKYLLNEGLIISEQVESQMCELKEDDNTENIIFTFTHDRIQQVGYLNVKEKDRELIHLKIADLLMQTLSQKRIKESLFDIVEHYNQASKLIPKEQKNNIIDLNIQATRKAKDSTAFLDSAYFAQCAVNLLDKDSWSKDYELSAQAYLELVQTLYLTSEYKKADELYKYISSHIKQDNHKLSLYNIQAKQYHHQGKFDKAVEIEYKALELLGLSLPKEEKKLLELFEKEQNKINESLKDTPIDMLYNKENTQDSQLIQTLEILFDTFVDAYLMGNGALITAVSAIMARISIENDNNKMSSIAYINYGSTLCTIGDDYESGHAFGTLAIRISQKYKVAALQNYTYHVFALSINHWMEPLSSSHRYWSEASKLSLASGSPYAGYVFLQLSHVLFASGNPLHEVQEQIDKSMAFLTQMKLEPIALLLKLIVAQPVKNLLGETKSTNTLDDENFSSEEFLNNFKDAAFFVGSYRYSQLRYTLMFEEYLSIGEATEYMELIEASQQGQIILPDSLFYYLLHICNAYYSLENDKEKEDCLNKIDAGLEKLEKWAALCKENFLHKYLLIKAQKAFIQNDLDLALDLAEKAIESAKENNFIQDTALCYEKTANFYLNMQKNSTASLYLEKAFHAYNKWGAKAKLEQLVKKYPDLLDNLQEMSHRTTMHKIDINSTYADTTMLSANIDILSVIKATQAISKQIILEDIAKALTSIAVENVGASKGVLILKEKKSFYLKCKVYKDNLNNLESQWLKENIDANNNKDFPSEIINYVLNTKENLILNDLSKSEQFFHKNINYQTKSICCLPIFYKDDLKGLLYLENSETLNAFKTNVLDTLTIFTTQAAISFENSQIYNELDNLNKNLEKIVQQRTQELNEKNSMLNQKNIELEYLSKTDLLTDIYNRRYLNEHIDKEMQRCRRYDSVLSVILIDIDKFKSVNDTYGHIIGDEVLILVSKILKDNLRISDIVGRWGGEEFLIISPIKLSDAILLANKLRQTIQNTNYKDINITISAGVAQYSTNESLSDLISRADKGLYIAKETGRNKVAEG